MMASPLDLPPQLPMMRRYRRHQSVPDPTPPKGAADAASTIEADHDLQVVRTRSCDWDEPCGFSIAYSDPTLVAKSQTNMDRLIRAAQQPEDKATTDTVDSVPKSNGVLLVKKALRYRKLQTRAQAVDLGDPQFLRIKWQKVDTKNTIQW